MATTNHERVGKALELLKAGLGPFVDREVQSAIKAQRVDPATLRRFVDDPQIADRPVAEWDAAALLKLMWDTWNDVFRVTSGRRNTASSASCAAIGTAGRIRRPSPATTPTARSIRRTGS